MSAAQAAAFAGLLIDALGRIARAAGGPDHNLMILTAPRGSRRAPHARWFAGIRPRLAEFGALEHATGFTVKPSVAGSDAAALRAAGGVG